MTATEPLAVAPIALAVFLEAFERQCWEQGVPPHISDQARRLFIETMASQTARGLLEYGHPLLVDDERDAFTDVAEDAVDSWLYIVRLRARLLTAHQALRDLAAPATACADEREGR